MNSKTLSTLKLSTAALTLALLAACSSTSVSDKKGKVSTNPGTPAAAVTNAPPAGDARAVATVTADSNDLDAQTKGLLGKRSVYFDYDKFDVKSEYQNVVEAHGKNLLKNKNQKVVIQGNTDERGGREYNLALGAKRADAVRKALNVVGVSDSQIETVSFGKEKPKASGNTEEAFAENRRADIVYQ
jgi:peptidoglycan-associated lipoprotein